LQQREINRVVQQEVERMCLQEVDVEVVQDGRRGLVACIRAGGNQEALALLLGRYSFQVEWLT
jgi:fatty-acyl-CoA synthase